MTAKRKLSYLLLAALALLAIGDASAQSLRPSGYFADAAMLGGRDWAIGGGLVWELPWQRRLLGQQVTTLAAASISHWQARGAGHSHGFTHVALVPLARMRFDDGRSPWFVDAGIGVSLTDRLFVTQTKKFTTTFNFVDTVGVGRSFGADRRQDLSLRLQHVSNAGIRVPNPGQNFVQLRYAAAF